MRRLLCIQKAEQRKSKHSLCRLPVSRKTQVFRKVKIPAKRSTEKHKRDCSLRSSQPDCSDLSSGQPNGGPACKSQKDVPSGQHQTSCRGLLCLGKEASLKAFLENGDVPMDNNAPESALRSFYLHKYT